MAQELMDGTIIPSYQTASDTRYAQPETGGQSNDKLRVGEVLELIHPTSKKSVSKKFMEYRVRVQHGDSGGGVGVEYPNAYIPNMFGGYADRLIYTLRPGMSKDRTQSLGLGSKVLILCINHETRNAIILSGLRDSGLEEKQDRTEADGHNLRFSFNGLEATITDDGGLIVSRRGATTASGEPRKDVKAEETGAILQMYVDGSLQIAGSDGGKDEEQNYIRLDRPRRTIEVSADSHFNCFAPAGIKMSSDNGSIQLIAPKTYIGSPDADQALMMGTQYRGNESTMHKGIQQGLGKLANALTSLATAISMAGKSIQIAAGLNSIPTTGGAAANTPFSAASQAMTMAEQHIKTAKSAVSEIDEKIGNFEQQSDTYLSKKNFADYDNG